MRVGRGESELCKISTNRATLLQKVPGVVTCRVNIATNTIHHP